MSPEATSSQHIEFIDVKHFRKYYHRSSPVSSLSRYIDFFWETNFDDLWEKYPSGFSDLLFPNIGYTYIINIGTPFNMQLEDKSVSIKSDAFLPRYKYIAAHHTKGNKVFGIKFKVSPLLLQKEIDFSEYADRILPLSYLLDPVIIKELKNAKDFETRVRIITAHYNESVEHLPSENLKIEIVTEILNQFYKTKNTNIKLSTFADHYGISLRTLQRYFKTTTTISAKKAFQLIRVRKAIEKFISNPGFKSESSGYYDYSHFHRDMLQFIKGHNLVNKAALPESFKKREV